jgi:U6 snRNA-associated Sm-like protein LSm2
MLFYSFFKTLVDKEVIVELKNDISLRGKLHSVDQYLNIKLSTVQVTEPEKHPYLVCVLYHMFIPTLTNNTHQLIREQ